MDKDELIQRYYDGNDSEATCIEALSDEIHRLQADITTKERQSKQLEEIIDRLQAENERLKEIIKRFLVIAEALKGGCWE